MSGTFGPSAGPKEPDYNLGPGQIAFIWTFTGIAAVILGLRLFAVTYVLNRVRAADYVMVASFVRLLRGQRTQS
jgi:hypothetical protein